MLGILLSLCILGGTVLAVGQAWVKPVEKRTVQTADAYYQPEEKTDSFVRIVRQKRKDPPKNADPLAQMPKAAVEGVYHILLLGTDEDGFRTDTIMLAHLDTNKNSAALLSIPRDCAVLKEAGDLMKLNAVYNGGGEAGVQRLEDALEKMLGFRPDGYILIDLEGFREAVDRMGGVWFDVPQDLYYSDPGQNLLIDLHKGYQLLDGQQALGLVRYRKGYATQDIQRTKVQQQFLLAAAKQLCSVKNLLQIRKFTELFSEYVLTDLSVGNMLWFAKQVLECGTDSIEMYTPEGEGVYINGISYYALYENALLRTLNSAFNPFNKELTAADICVISPEKAEIYRPALQEDDGAEAEESDAIDDSERNPPGNESETDREIIQPPEINMTGLEEIE